MEEEVIVYVVISKKIAKQISGNTIDESKIQASGEVTIQIVLQSDVTVNAIIRATIQELGGILNQNIFAWLHLESTLENVLLDEPIKKVSRLRYERMRIESW